MTDQTAQPGPESKPQAGASGSGGSGSGSSNKKITIGWIHPLTGPLPPDFATPSLPWTPSFTGQTCQQLADAYTAAGNGQPNANISNYTLFEIAYNAFTLVNDPHNKEEVAAAIHKVVIPDAVAGPMDFTSAKNPAPGVVITPPVGIQWQKGTKYPLEAVVVDNTLLPQAKITGDLLPTFK